MSKSRKEKTTLQRVSISVSERIDKLLEEESGMTFRSKAHFIDVACEKLLEEIEHRRGKK